MNVTIDKQSVLYNQPSVTQTQSIFIWPIRAIRRHFDAGSMSSTPCSSLHFSNSKTSSGHHCCLQVLWFAATATRPGTGVLLFPQFKMPLSPCCSSLVHGRLAPSCYPNLPFLKGMRPWSCVAAHPTWTSSFCMCLLCDRRHLKYLPNIYNQPPPLQSREGLTTAVQKLGSNSHLKDRWIKKCNRHCCWK